MTNHAVAQHPIYAELQDRYVSEAEMRSAQIDRWRDELDDAERNAAEIADCCGGREPDCYQHYRSYPL